MLRHPFINALNQYHYYTGTIRTQFRDQHGPSSEEKRPQTAKAGSRQPNPPHNGRHPTRARRGSRTRPTEATAPVKPRRPATARTRATTRRRTGPATTAPAEQSTPTNASPARSRCTIPQSTTISRSKAQKIRQTETARSQQPTSAAPTISPKAPRSALKLKEGETPAVLFILHSTPHRLAGLKSKIQHSRNPTLY